MTADDYLTALQHPLSPFSLLLTDSSLPVLSLQKDGQTAMLLSPDQFTTAMIAHYMPATQAHMLANAHATS